MSMEILEQDILELTINVWSSVLELEVHPAPGPIGSLETERTLSGCITLDGAWRGAVAIHCTTALARKVASVMFGVEPEKASVAEVQDALGEITNMVGGQIKSLLPRPTRLSLPAVAEGGDYTLRIPGCTLINRLLLVCQGEPFQVSLLELAAKEEPENQDQPQSVATR